MDGAVTGYVKKNIQQGKFSEHQVKKESLKIDNYRF